MFACLISLQLRLKIPKTVLAVLAKLQTLHGSIASLLGPSNKVSQCSREFRSETPRIEDHA